MRLQFASLTVAIVATIPASIQASNRSFKYRTNAIQSAFSLPVEISSSAKEELLSYSLQLNSESKTGVFISDEESKKQVKKLAAELEAVCDNPTVSSQSLMLGDWKLLCSIATPSDDITSRLPSTDSKKGPFGLPLPSPPEFLTDTFNPIQKNIRDSVEVVQRIRVEENFENSDDVLNRVDNVIEFTPFSLENFANLNLNPLEVSKTKVALVHSAKVESISPLLRTKLVLKSVILNVAGTSQVLEPSGLDVLSLNVPLGDLFNFGYFDTTYVDEKIRISRGKVGIVDQLRIFVRADDDDDEIMDEENGDVETTMIENEAEAVEVEEETEKETPATAEVEAEMAELEPKEDGEEEEDDPKMPSANL